MFLTYSSFSTANQKVVVINPGHSLGYDSGANGAVKCEAQVNQELAGKVVKLLAERGYKVYITHTTDESLASYRLLNQADGSSLRSVGIATNSVNPDLAMSIHHNSGGASSTGYEIYWSSYRSFDQEGIYTVSGLWSDGANAYRDSTPCLAASESKRFASILQDHMAGIPKLSYRYTVERDDYLPAHSTAPCVLYEGGYLSNPSEAAYLASEDYQNQAANRIVNAIDEFLGGSGFEDHELPSINSITTSTTETGDFSFSIACNVTDDTQVASVKFATWTEANGQDDLVWRDAQYDGDNNWSCTINISEHNNETGAYLTHVYAYDIAGNFVGSIGPVVNVGVPSEFSQQGISVKKINSNVALSYANNLGSDEYKFAVWSEINGQDDIIWSDGIPQVNSSSKCIINRSEHNNDWGKYTIHCYTKDMEFVGANEVDFGQISTASIDASIEGNYIRVSLTGLDTPDGYHDVRFAIWSEENGTDDIAWHLADARDGVFTASARLEDHPGGGAIWVHAYLTDDFNLDQFVGAASVYSGTPNPGVQVDVAPQAGNQVVVTCSNVAEGTEILVPCWSDENGQDDLIWYEAVKQGGFHVATINVGNHTGVGTYTLHVYTRDPDGTLTPITGRSFLVQAPATQGVTGDTPIMGNSGTTVAQLVNLYNENSPIAFPDYYINRGVSLGDFATMYIEEANNENVRADLAFCQAMHETGWLRFGGDVSISQFNFAGLGATGGGVAGENFAATHGDNAYGIRMGIRAQVQHLKAYGSTEPLSQECVDTRFGYVTRGKAATISGLTGTWAADPNYAPKILAVIAKIK